MIDCPEEMHSLASKERAMTQASYNDIAQWYDQFLRERPVYTEVILPNLLALVGEVEGEVICDLACGRQESKIREVFAVHACYTEAADVAG